ncbi:MAG: MDR family MFS transporter [Thermoanaerobaculia bacterium]
MVNPWRGLRGLPREVWVLFTATLVNRAGSMVLPFLVLYLTRELAFSPGLAGFVVLLYGAGALIAAPISGALSDLVGPVQVMRASLALSGAILFLFLLADDVPSVIAATFALSVVTEAFRPASMAIVGDLVTPEQRKTAFAVNRLAINLGMSVGPAVGGYLAGVAFRWIFVVNGACALDAAVILILSPLRRARHTAATHEITDAVAPGAHVASHPSRFTPRILLSAIGAPFRTLFSARFDRRLAWMLFGVFLLAVVFFQHFSSMPLFLVQELGLNEAQYGLLFTVNTLLIVFLEVPINTSTAHWSHRRNLALGAFLSAAGFGALAFAWDFWSAAATVVIWTFGEMFFFPGMAAYLTDIAPENRRGEYMGLSQMVMGLAFMVGPWMGMQALARLGGRALWLLVFLCGLASTLVFLRLSEVRAVAGAAGLPSPTTAPSTEP